MSSENAGPTTGEKTALSPYRSQSRLRADETRMTPPSPSKGPRRSQASDQSTSPTRTPPQSIRSVIHVPRWMFPMPMTRHPNSARKTQHAADSPAPMPAFLGLNFPRQSHDHHRPRGFRSGNLGPPIATMARRRTTSHADRTRSLAARAWRLARSANAATAHSRLLLRRYRSGLLTTF